MTDSPIVFLHVPKTAGGSLRQAWAGAARKSGKVFKSIYTVEVAEEQVRDADYIFGHVSYGTIEKFDLTPRYVTFFRHPVHRVISHFYHLAAYAEDNLEIRDLIRDRDINTFFEEVDYWEFDNLACRQISGHGRNVPNMVETYKAARENMEQMEFVGFQEFFDISCLELSNLVGLTISPHFKTNVSDFGSSDLSRKTLGIIGEKNALDIRLYQEALAVQLPMQPSTTQVGGHRLVLEDDEFVTEPASLENSFELFDGAWISAVPGYGTGSMHLFSDSDIRPAQFLKFCEDITGWEILELGSFEGGHAYQLEQMGAFVTGVEANPSIFLRGLIAKNALGMRAQFLLGEFQRYLEDLPQERKYDAIFCSGVLYHMRDPVELIRQAARHTDRLFIWAHYVSDEVAAAWPQQDVHAVSINGVEYTYYRYNYPLNWGSRSFSGVASYCSRITLNAMHAALLDSGFDRVTVVLDDVEHPGGPAVTLAASRGH